MTCNILRGMLWIFLMSGVVGAVKRWGVGGHFFWIFGSGYVEFNEFQFVQL